MAQVIRGFPLWKLSPVDIPFVKQEPLLALRLVYMNIFVEAANNEDLVVVADGLWSEELFRFLERAFHTFDLTALRVQGEAIWNPSVVTTEDEDFRVVEWKTAHGVSCWPEVVLVDDLNRFPLLLFKITKSIKALDRVKWRFVLRVSTTNHIKVAIVQDADRVVMSGRVQFTDFGPLVLCHIVDFTFFRSVIWIFGTDCEKIVFCLVLHPFVKVSELMARSSILHWSTPFYFVCLLIDNKAISSDDRSDLVFFLLTTDTEHLVLNLDWGEILRQDFGVAETDWGSCLGSQFMNEQLLVFVVIVMKSWSVLLQNKVWFKTHNIVQETAEFVYFTAHFNLGPWVFFKVLLMLINLWVERGRLALKHLKRIPFSQHLEELPLIAHFSLFGYAGLNALDEFL